MGITSALFPTWGKGTDDGDGVGYGDVEDDDDDDKWVFITNNIVQVLT